MTEPEQKTSDRPLRGRGRGWTHRTAIRYALFQIPGIAAVTLALLVLRSWVDLPTWAFWAILLVWVAKDAALFPLLWRAYDADHGSPMQSMVGEEGVAMEKLDPSGYIRVRGELWRACLADGAEHVKEGGRVKVENVRGLTLLVTGITGGAGI